MLVEGSPRYALNEFRRSPGVHDYRIRGGGPRVCLRHGISSWPFEEIFRHRAYEPPSAVARAIGSTDEPLSILDLGANVGYFGAWVRTRFPHPEVLAFEPDPTTAAVHERCIRLNDAEDSWTLVRAIAADEDGQSSFVAAGTGSSRIASEDEAKETVVLPTEDVLPRVQDADFVKMDIEGGEWRILADPRFGAGRTRAVVLEYHPHLSPGPDTASEAGVLLRRAGFDVVDPGLSAEQFPAGQGMLWGVRR